MKKLFFLLFLALPFMATAQYVTIPDANFRTFLQGQYPACFNAQGKMDTTCNAVVTEDTLRITNVNNPITNITGIRYFDNLITLYCISNNISSLPQLPNRLQDLNCSKNNLSSLPNLPNSLKRLDFSENQFTVLPLLPVGLEILSCGRNSISNLPNLPNTLTELSCGNNQISNLPNLPNTLTNLECSSNNLSALPSLPNNLSHLNCSSNPIGILPPLPNSMSWLACCDNQLTVMPVLPNNMYSIECWNNQITHFTNFPTNVKYILCNNNKLTHLPILPNPLFALNCSFNCLTELPNLNNKMLILDCSHNQIIALPRLNDSLSALHCSNNPITCLPFVLPPLLRTLNVDSTQITCLPNHPIGLTTNLTPANIPLCLPNNPNGCLFAARIYGTVKKATNCVATTQNLPNMLVTATNTATSEIYVANSDASGGYEIAVPTGTYTVSVAPPNGYWGVCTSAQNIVITQSGQQESRDVLLNAVVACADMSVRHTDAAVMRPCTTSVYRVSYFNAGTIAAAGAYAEITLAAEQTFVSASLPSLALGGGRFRFQLPTVAALERGVFEVNVQVACSVIMGQQLCTDVAVFPHTFCSLPALWDGSDVAVSGRCVGNNQVRFVLTNRGAGAMSAPQTYSIIEDNLMIRSGQIQLLVAGSDSVTITADPLRVYRIVVNESPYNPAGNTQETVLVWGCNGLSQNIHWASVNQYPLNSGADYIHRLCTTVRTSFDPNDISAVPAGVGAQHFIQNNTILEYKIRFQNTGNDTAFVVRLLNQLPPELDKTTLKIGAGSHPFTYSLKANGVLEFLFTNIRLEDSTSNEPKSHGFVTYSIKTKPNLAVGTTIHNQANIYFDTNAPVATNIYTHTIGEIVVSTVQSIDNQNIIVKIMPNPMHDAAIFEIGDSQSPTLLTLTLYNTLGQTVKTQRFVDGKLILERDNLPQGCYFYKISNTNGLLTQGKLIME
jgi:Leucine-rich repeat (LRR) protein